MEVPDFLHRFFVQVAHIVFGDLLPGLSLDDAFFRVVHDKLAREMGVGPLLPGRQYEQNCARFFMERFDPWGTAPDLFLKTRLSLVELLFRMAEERVRSQIRSRHPKRASAGQDAGSNPEVVFAEAVQELDDRFRSANLPFHYHNGMIQFARNELTQKNDFRAVLGAAQRTEMAECRP